MKRLITALALVATLTPYAAQADGTLDGVIGAAYGSPKATDASGDAANGHAILDCTELYVYDDGPGTNVFFALKLSGDIAATNWGNYMFYIETDNGSPQAGIGNGNGWNRPIQADGSSFKPTYWVGSWVNGPNGMQLWKYSSGSSWNMVGTAPTIGGIAFVGTPTGSVIEYSIPRSQLGNPTTVRIIGMASGGGGGDNAQDSIGAPSGNTPQAAGGNWGGMVTMNVTPNAVTVPVTVSGFAID